MLTGCGIGVLLVLGFWVYLRFFAPGNELGNSQYDDPDDDGADEMLHPEWFCTNCKAELINIHGVMHCPNCGQDSVKT